MHLPFPTPEPAAGRPPLVHQDTVSVSGEFRHKRYSLGHIHLKQKPEIWDVIGLKIECHIIMSHYTKKILMGGMLQMLKVDVLVRRA